MSGRPCGRSLQHWTPQRWGTDQSWVGHPAYWPEPPMNNENLAPGSFQHRRSIAICIDSVLVICHNQKTPSCMTKLTGDSTFHGSSIQCLKNFHPFPHHWSVGQQLISIVQYPLMSSAMVGRWGIHRLLCLQIAKSRPWQWENGWPSPKNW